MNTIVNSSFVHFSPTVQLELMCRLCIVRVVSVLQLASASVAKGDYEAVASVADFYNILT